MGREAIARGRVVGGLTLIALLRCRARHGGFGLWFVKGVANSRQKVRHTGTQKFSENHQRSYDGWHALLMKWNLAQVEEENKKENGGKKRLGNYLF